MLVLRVRPDRSGQKSTLDRVKKDILIRHLNSRDLVDKGNKRDLQRRLFGEIIGRTLVNPSAAAASGNESSSTAAVVPNITDANGNDPPPECDNISGIKEKKKFAWRKGGLLSLLANYVEQYHNFGQCHIIW